MDRVKLYNLKSA